MKSIKEIYRIGRGPSSSHTMGPEAAAKMFIGEFPSAERYEAVLYGSLAKTGKGHGTDRVLRETFAPRALDIKLDLTATDIPHPNTLDFTAFDKNGNVIGKRRVLSVGGGAIEVEGHKDAEPPEVYPFENFAQIKEYCKKESIRIPDLVERFEGVEIWQYLDRVWEVMNSCIKRGLAAEGELPSVLVESTYQHEMENIQQQLQMQRLSLDRYLSQIHQTRENFTANVHAAAEKNTRARMALLQVAQNEGLVPTDEEITKNLQERADRTKKTLEEVKANANIPAMQRSEAIRRAADWVIEHSTIEEK